MELQKVYEALNTYIRPATSPVAAKMVSSANEIPEKARMPKRDLKITVPVCQGITLCRRMGLTLAMGKDDMLCPPGAITLGLVEAKDKFLDGSANVPHWLKNQDVITKMNKNCPRFVYGKYTHLVVAPLNRATFEPQVIIVYGNPAQITRLIQSAVYSTGEPVVSSNFGGLSCGLEITMPILTNQYQVVISGGGERGTAQVQDGEMAFAAPVSKLDALVEGLEGTHKAGFRYPTVPFLLYQAQLPPHFDKLMDYLKEDN